MGSNFPKIASLKLQGYRPFKDLEAGLSPLEVIAGANGSGKSSLFEFLRFLRDAVRREIPPEIVAGSIGQQIFHRPGPDKFRWDMEITIGKPVGLSYQGELLGPVGRRRITSERVASTGPVSPDEKEPFVFMEIRNGEAHIREPESKALKKLVLSLTRLDQLVLSTAITPDWVTLYELREFINEWRFYSAFNINNEKIRKSVPTQQEPSLKEDAGNLSAVLFYLMTEYPDVFEELQTHLRLVIPGFKKLTVKARGGPGEVIAFWQEDGMDDELTLAYLSDGILRFLCWAVLCVMPNPPTLICIDEPDQGVHPRTLPVLAGLLQKACRRTQILLATHASYFLTQFPVEHLAVMKKVNGEALFTKPKDSKALIANLDEFGSDEIEAMHRSDELENLS